MMRQIARNIVVAVFSVAATAGTLLIATSSPALAADKPASAIEKGKAVAVNRKKGNCVACHVIEDEPLPGNIGPPLVGMKLRYPDKAKLRAHISDATKANPNTAMPPFGRHKILSEQELDQVVEYVYTL